MIQRKDDWQVKCPYYHGEQETVIFCKGILDRYLVSIHCERKGEKADYKYDFCKGNYKACPMFQAADSM